MPPEFQMTSTIVVVVDVIWNSRGIFFFCIQNREETLKETLEEIRILQCRQVILMSLLFFVRFEVRNVVKIFYFKKTLICLIALERLLYAMGAWIVEWYQGDPSSSTSAVETRCNVIQWVSTCHIHDSSSGPFQQVKTIPTFQMT